MILQEKLLYPGMSHSVPLCANIVIFHFVCVRVCE